MTVINKDDTTNVIATVLPGGAGGLPASSVLLILSYSGRALSSRLVTDVVLLLVC